MKIGWGWKIALLYGAFVVLIVTLVTASSRQHFDLVSKDYYSEEIAYQGVIDASKNQSTLSEPLSIHANATALTISFPEEFKEKTVTGKVEFYSPVDSKWDRSFDIETQNNVMNIQRSLLNNTRYTIKISFMVNGKKYYQESEIFLHA